MQTHSMNLPAAGAVEHSPVDLNQVGQIISACDNALTESLVYAMQIELIKRQTR